MCQVNRLTRDLSTLRQQLAATSSTASSISTSYIDQVGSHVNHGALGSDRPVPSRHRSSSSLGAGGVSTSIKSNPSGSPGFLGMLTAQDSTGGPLISRGTEALSRHDSIASSRRSELSSLLAQNDPFSMPLSHRQSQQSHAPRMCNS